LSYQRNPFLSPNYIIFLIENQPFAKNIPLFLTKPESIIFCTD